VAASAHKPVLHMLCGKIASGKSTLAAQLAQAPGTILVSQDRLMLALYPEENKSVADFIRLAPRLRGAIAPLLIDVLRAGVSVVLDWAANTKSSRAWMRSIFQAADADHRLHVLPDDDALCLQRLAARNEEGRHEYQVSRAEYDELMRYFEPPSPDEGFTIVRH
jgi:predicted kinase